MNRTICTNRNLLSGATENLQSSRLVFYARRRDNNPLGADAQNTDEENQANTVENRENSQNQTNVRDVAEQISSQIKQQIESLFSLDWGVEVSSFSPDESVDYRKNIDELRARILNLNARNRKINLKLQSYFHESYVQSMISEDNSKKIIDLSPLDEEMESKLNDLLNTMSLGSSPTLISKIVELKQEQKQEMTEINSELKDIVGKTREIGAKLFGAMERMEIKEFDKRSFCKEIGIDLQKDNKVLIYNFIKDDGTIVKRRAKIASFDNSQSSITLDDGKVYRMKTSTPELHIVLEPLDGLKEEKVTLVGNQIHDAIDSGDLSEPIVALNATELPPGAQDKGDLALSLIVGKSINPGDAFDFETSELSADMRRALPRFLTFKILGVDPEKQLVILDREVPSPEKKSALTNTLTYKQFARFFNKNDCCNAIETIEELREKLKEMQKDRNESMGIDGVPRNSDDYPPIEVKENEKIYIDSIPKKVFTIEKVKDGKVYLSGGDEIPFGSFLKKAKDEFIEKYTEKNEEEDITNGEEIKADDSLSDVPPIPIKAARKSWWKNLKDGTMWISFKHIKTLVKDIMAQRKAVREKKEDMVKTETVGQKLAPGYFWLKHISPYLDGVENDLESDYKTRAQNRNNEKIGKLKSQFKEYGPVKIREILRDNLSPNHLKACLDLLADVGELRWDDEDVQNVVRARLNDKDYDFSTDLPGQMKRAIDKLFGAGSYESMYKNNESRYESRKKDFASYCDKLAPPQLKRRLQEILLMHINDGRDGKKAAAGKDVVYAIPAEYEQLLSHAIKNDFLAPPSEYLHFLFLGMGARNGRGTTLIDSDRVLKICQENASVVPYFQHFSKGIDQVSWDDKEKKWKQKRLKKMDKNGNIVEIDAPKAQASRENFEKWVEELFSNDLSNVKSINDLEMNPKLNAWVKETLDFGSSVQGKIDKSAQSPPWNTDSIWAFAPRVKAPYVHYLLHNQSRINVRSVENILAGYNHYIKETITKLNHYKREKNKEKMEESLMLLKDFIASYVRFQAILDSRLYKKNGKSYTRWTQENYRRAAGCDDSRSVGAHKNELEAFIKSLCEGLGLKSSWDNVMRGVEGEIEEIGTKIEGEMYDRVVSGGPDGVEKVVDIINRIQHYNSLSDLDVKGFKGKAKVKVSKDDDEIEKKVSTKLSAYNNPEIASYVKALKDLKSGKPLAVSKDVPKSDVERVERLIELANRGKFSQFTSQDVEILKHAIKTECQRKGIDPGEYLANVQAGIEETAEEEEM